jgi:hypothetical protein
MADGGAARHPLLGQIEQGHDIGAGNQHAIERAHRGDKVGPLARAQQRRDHGIHRRALDAHVIARALLVGRRRAPVEALLVARRKRLLPAIFDHGDRVGIHRAQENGLLPRRLLASRSQRDKLEERCYLDPDRRGDRADEAEAIETFLMDALTKR